jgi:hypothetical protein
VAGEAAAEAGLDLAERQVDLVMEDDDALERDLERAARRPGGATRFVHERLRQQDRHPRAAGPDPAFGDLAAELPLRLRQVPATEQLGADLEADVVAGPGVLSTGVAEADDQDSLAVIGVAAAEEGQELTLAGVAARVAPAIGLLAALLGRCLALLADELGLLLDLGLGLFLDARR